MIDTGLVSHAHGLAVILSVAGRCGILYVTCSASYDGIPSRYLNKDGAGKLQGGYSLLMMHTASLLASKFYPLVFVLLIYSPGREEVRDLHWLASF